MIKLAKSTIKPNQLRNWIPFIVSISSTNPKVYWTNIGKRAVAEPFFRDTIISLKSEKRSALMLKTDMKNVIKIATQIPAVQPKGFIFHTGRCGSTLLANMLRGLTRNFVLSEPQPIGAVLRIHLENPQHKLDIQQLKAITSVLGYQRTGRVQDLIIKFQHWSILEIEFLSNAYPHTPWIFLYRDLREVMASLKKGPAKWQHEETKREMGNYLAGSRNQDWAANPDEDYCTQVLAHICRFAIKKADSNALFMNYEDLTNPKTFRRILHHFNIKYTDTQFQKMLSARKFYSKTTQKGIAFKNDGLQKKKTKAFDLKKKNAKLLEDVFQELKQDRLASPQKKHATKAKEERPRKGPFFFAYRRSGL